MIARRQFPPHRRGQACRASWRPRLLGLLSFVLLLSGQGIALADRPDDPADPSGNANGAAASAFGQGQAETHANLNSAVAARAEAAAAAEAAGEPEAEVEVDFEVRVDDGSRGGAGNSGGNVDSSGGNVGGSGRNRSGEGQGGDNHSKITLCHATGSVTNPYVVITVARAAADGISGNSRGHGDHYGEHSGPIFDPDGGKDQPDWGDIIPPYDDGGNPMPHNGRNWSNEMEDLWDAVLGDDADACIPEVAGPQPEITSPPVHGRTVTPPTTPPTLTPPRGIAFTGPALVPPLTALAIALMTTGTGLLWAARSRNRAASTRDR
jgi:hypothetical protein